MRHLKGDDGYTLAECLVALFVLGLAISGLSAGAMVISKAEVSTARRSSEERRARDLEYAFADLLNDTYALPVGADSDFQGSADHFQFHCAPNQKACSAWLTQAQDGIQLHISKPQSATRVYLIRGVSSARFVYTGSQTIGPTWPSDGQDLQSLHSVSVLADTATGVTPILSARVWIEQAADCYFDPIARTCRK